MKKFCLIVLLFLTACSIPGTLKRSGSNTSILILNMKYKSFGLQGYGGYITIKNIDTQEVFSCQKKISFDSDIILSNIPTGTYSVEQLVIITGSRPIVLQTANFNNIDIDKPCIFYLGNYLTEKIPPAFDYRIQISEKPNPSNAEIYKKVRENSNSWMNLDICFEELIFKNDSTIVDFS